ncbi:guanine nucleotide binding protein, alpha subunit [Mycena filopes]|nr:guanine nucleotide binding protein, alpha subunit [Mycena filopes]
MIRLFPRSPKVDEATAHSNAIDEEIKKDRAILRRSGRKFVALLGGPGAGRSTFLRQVKLFSDGYNEREREELAMAIQANLLAESRLILEERMSTSDDPSIPQALSSLVDAVPPYHPLSTPIQTLLATPVVQQSLQYAALLSAKPSLQYTLDALPRIAAPGYTPTDLDILHCAFPPPPPVVEVALKAPSFDGSFDMETTLVRVRRDVGLQRKWLSHLYDAEALIFLVDLSCYDQTVYSSETDEQVNCMRETMREWESVCNSRLLDARAVILILNKYDLFTAKLPHVPFTACFPEYTGPNEPGPAAAYCIERFGHLYRVFRVRSPSLSSWCTNALDRDQMRGPLREMLESIIRLRMYVQIEAW